MGLAHVAPAVPAEDLRASFAWPQKPEQRQDERGLARAVGPEQTHGFSRARNAKTAGDPVKDLPPSKFDFQALEFDDRDLFQGSPATLERRCRITVPVSRGSGSRAPSRP